MLTVSDILIAAAARNPSSVALTDGESSYSYETLLSLCRRLLSGFDHLGLRHGDRLVVIMQNRAEFAILHWAAQLGGIVITPLNWRFSAAELDAYLKNSGAAALVYEDIAAEAVAGSGQASGLLKIKIDDSDDIETAFGDLCRFEPARDIRRAGADDLSVLLYTSGTTGTGKGVPRSHRAERAAAVAHVAQNALLVGDSTLGVMPLYHTMGVRLLLAMALVNGTFACQPRFEAAGALALIERHRLTTLYLVPTLYHDLVSHERFGVSDISSVRCIGFAGAPMTDGLLERLAREFKPKLFVNHYGSSEIYTFSIDQQAALKPGSAGKAGINGEVRVVVIGSRDIEAITPRGQEGEIIARLDSDEAFAGYWMRPDADRNVLIDGWYFTGDVGYCDRDGDLFVTGRVDDMMISGGENVLPVEIESVLSLHSAVGEVTVVGLPDTRLGHKITAFIRRSGTVTATELDTWCRNSDLSHFKRPREYVFVDSIPKSPVGKILRRQLVAGNFKLDLS